MTIGPEPMMRIFLRSSRRGIFQATARRARGIKQYRLRVTLGRKCYATRRAERRVKSTQVTAQTDERTGSARKARVFMPRKHNQPLNSSECVQSASTTTAR